MIGASSLELFMLFCMASSHDLRTRLLGSIVWCCYLRYSATRALLAQVAKWLHDRNNPPGGPA